MKRIRQLVCWIPIGDSYINIWSSYDIESDSIIVTHYEQRRHINIIWTARSYMLRKTKPTPLMALVDNVRRTSKSAPAPDGFTRQIGGLCSLHLAVVSGDQYLPPKTGTNVVQLWKWEEGDAAACFSFSIVARSCSTFFGCGALAVSTTYAVALDLLVSALWTMSASISNKGLPLLSFSTWPKCVCALCCSADSISNRQAAPNLHHRCFDLLARQSSRNRLVQHTSESVGSTVDKIIKMTKRDVTHKQWRAIFKHQFFQIVLVVQCMDLRFRHITLFQGRNHDMNRFCRSWRQMSIQKNEMKTTGWCDEIDISRCHTWVMTLTQT